MGQKGSKLTDEATDASVRLESALAGLGDISRKKMFGGYGIFESGKMFALVSSEGGAYFKADDSNRERFEESGSEKYGKMPYYSLTNRIVDNRVDLHEWAGTSIRTAHAAPSKKK
jgi:DNA transformation protein